VDTSKRVEKLRQVFGGPMSAEDVAFLRDIQGMIEWAIKNGLSLPVVVATLAHDVNELSRHGFNLKDAKEQGFRPKIDGYAHVDDDSVGETENAA
jgi:hypothetical protein